MNNKAGLLPLKIEGNRNSPKVDFNAQSGELILKGRSILENTVEFYTPILVWLDEYYKNPLNNTRLNIDMDYFNTSSSKFILDILTKMKDICNLEKEVQVSWCYSDDETFELGKDYAELLNIPFEFVKIQ